MQILRQRQDIRNLRIIETVEQHLPDALETASADERADAVEERQEREPHLGELRGVLAE